MSTKYKATTTEEAYFITITTVGWIDVFTRPPDDADMPPLPRICNSRWLGYVS
jgi:hypothetical protein